MDLALLYFDGCPNLDAMEQNLHTALHQAALTGIAVRRQRVETMEDAERVGFTGSPTIWVNGRDPFADPDAAIGLSCRLYTTDAGLAGAPTVDQLRTALTAAN